MTQQKQEKDLINNSQSSMPKSKLSNQIVPYISIIISIIALLISIYGLRETRTNRNLTYSLEVKNASYENEEIKFDMIFDVRNGAISEYRVFNYGNSEITQITHNYADNISKIGSPVTKTANYSLQLSDGNESEYYVALYFLIKGTDGSKHLDMIMFHIDLINNTADGKIYYQDELAFLNLYSDSIIYRRAYDDYIELYEQIKKYE